MGNYTVSRSRFTRSASQAHRVKMSSAAAAAANESPANAEEVGRLVCVVWGKKNCGEQHQKFISGGALQK